MMKDALQTILTLAAVGLVIWAFLSAVLWIGGLWDSVIDNAYENEIYVVSEIPEIPSTDIQIQWFQKDEIVWLMRNGLYSRNLPERDGINHFRVFVRNRPIHTFQIRRTTATQKMRYDFLLRSEGDTLIVQARWEPFFYSDDAVRSAPYYERAKYPLSVLSRPANP